MHFSFAFGGFIKAQVAQFHPPTSEGGSSPAAPQSNPPLVPVTVDVVVEGFAPNPVELGLNGDPTGLNPDKGVDLDEVDLDAPNTNGPGDGVGIEKTLLEPEARPEDDAPGLGASQTVQLFFADPGFIKSQVLHFHSSASAVGGLNPAALQSNPPELVVVGGILATVGVLPEPRIKGEEDGLGAGNGGVAEDFSAPGFGVSHTVHFSVADGGFDKSHVPHFQLPVFVGGFNPAALQSNPPEPVPVAEVVVVVSAVARLEPKTDRAEGGLGMAKEGGVGFVAPGLRESHTVHFSDAEAGFIRSQVPHFHPSSRFGGFSPAALQSNPPFAAGGVIVEVEAGKMVELALGPVLLGFEGPEQAEERLHASSMGISSSVNPLTSFSAIRSPELLPSLSVLQGRVNVSAGRSETAIERTSALASFGEVMAVGDIEDAEDAVSSLSALMLNRNFEGSLGAEDLSPKKDLPVVVGEIVGAGEEVPFRPAVCS